MAQRRAQFAYLFAALHVQDRDAALPWYQQLFGRPPDFVPNNDEAVWQVADTASVYILAEGTVVGGGDVNLIVDDLEATLVGLRLRNIHAGPIVMIGDVGRKFRVFDPDGNSIWFTELG
jgi:predicted enzyme related to lactoylglutathione lyase